MVVAVDAAVSVVCDQVNQEIPANLADDIDEAHQVEPAHQVDQNSRHWRPKESLETGRGKRCRSGVVPGQRFQPTLAEEGTLYEVLSGGGARFLA